MRFGVLGPLAVWTDTGEPVQVPEAKVRALLADLLLHEGAVVSADRLVDDLWGVRLPRNPSNTLQTKISQLRRVLAAEPGGRDLVSFGAGGYRLHAEDTDVARFRTLVARSRRTEDLSDRAALLVDALGLWRGDAFAEFAGEPFAEAAARRLDEERLTAIEELLETRLGLGAHAELLGELTELVAAHPLRERLCAIQIRALYRAGRQTDALAAFAALRERLADDLGLDPSPELAALHQSILVQDTALDRQRSRQGNLPAAVTGLIGRNRQLDQVRAALGTSRLVTLTGPGGVGKTALAVEAAARFRDGYPDGVWLVELAGLGGEPAATRLAQVVLDVLGIREDAPAGPLPAPSTAGVTDRLVAALRGKHVLIVLDNCEHVVDAAAELAGLLLRAGAGVRIIATSQEALGMTGETLFPVPPLDLPDGEGPIADAGAVRLFAERARAAAPGFELDDTNAGAVAAICRELDGIPLAIELAASRMRVLGADDLLARLDDRFSALRSVRRDAPPRQRTLRAMIDWSWELLSDEERAVLRRLAAHPDGCALDAAEAVSSGGGVAPGEVLDVLDRLVNRSLVAVVESPGGRRYRLLESVAAYSRERLREAGESAATAERLVTFYVELAELADSELRGHQQRRWLLRLDAESANLRAALDIATERGDGPTALRLVTALAWYWFLRGKVSLARHAITSALESRTAPEGARARAEVWRAGFALLAGERADRESLGRWTAIDDPVQRVRARWFGGNALLTVGDYLAEEQTGEEIRADFEATGDIWGTAAALIDRASYRMTTGLLAEAERDATEAGRVFRELGDRWGSVQASFVLGTTAEIAGDYRRAAAQHRDGLRMAEELELWPEVSYQLSWLGRISLLTKDFEQSVELHEQARRIAAEQSFTPGEVYAETGLALVARRTGRFDDAERYLRRAHRWHRLVDFDGANTLVLAELGFIAELRGDHERAAALHGDGLALARKTGEPRAVALGLEGLAGAHASAGRPRAAARFLGAASAARASVGAPLPDGERGDVDRIAAIAREALGDEDYEHEFASGAELGPDQVEAAPFSDG